MATDFPLRFPDGQRLEPTMVDADGQAVGDLLTVESDGVGGLRSNWLSGGFVPRSTVTITTAELASSARESGSFTLNKGAVLYRIRERRNLQCRVRLYGTAAARDADAARAYTMSAVSGSGTTGTGLAAEFVLSSGESYDIHSDPKPIVANQADTATTTVYYTIENLTYGTVAFLVELTYKAFDT